MLRKRVISVFVKLIVCVCILTIGYCARTFWQFFKAYDNPSMSLDIEDSKDIEDLVGWINISGTNIDFPIVQGKNNLQYLNIDVYGEENLSGSIFLDSRNSPDFSDAYNIVYGHHMELDGMFGGLDRFMDKKYLDEHDKGTLTVGSNEYEVEFFDVIKADEADAVFFNTESLIADLDRFCIVPSDSCRVIALTTCADESERLILLGKIKEGI